MDITGVLRYRNGQKYYTVKQSYGHNTEKPLNFETGFFEHHGGTIFQAVFAVSLLPLVLLVAILKQNLLFWVLPMQTVLKLMHTKIAIQKSMVKYNFKIWSFYITIYSYGSTDI